MAAFGRDGWPRCRVLTERRKRKEVNAVITKLTTKHRLSATQANATTIRAGFAIPAPRSANPAISAKRKPIVAFRHQSLSWNALSIISCFIGGTLNKACVCKLRISIWGAFSTSDCDRASDLFREARFRFQRGRLLPARFGKKRRPFVTPPRRRDKSIPFPARSPESS
jgi:hypothetical protein